MTYQREGGREGRRERWREGGREGGRDGGKEGEMEGEREGGRGLGFFFPLQRGASVSPAVFETHIASVHQRFHGYQDEVIDKWNTKTRLASGKINSKVHQQGLFCKQQQQNNNIQM